MQVAMHSSKHGSRDGAGAGAGAKAGSDEGDVEMGTGPYVEPPSTSNVGLLSVLQNSVIRVLFLG